MCGIIKDLFGLGPTKQQKQLQKEQLAQARMQTQAANAQISDAKDTLYKSRVRMAGNYGMRALIGDGSRRGFL